MFFKYYKQIKNVLFPFIIKFYLFKGDLYRLHDSMCTFGLVTHVLCYLYIRNIS